MAARTFTFTSNGTEVVVTSSDGRHERNIAIPCDVFEEQAGNIIVRKDKATLWRGSYTVITAINGSSPSSQNDARQKLATIFKAPGDTSVPTVVSGNMSVVGVELTRPNDTTAYAVKDCISDSTTAPGVIQFAGAARLAGKGGYITKARLMSDNTNLATSSVLLKLHLFHTAPTAINDNAAYALLYNNKDKRIATITFPAMNTEGAGSTGSHALFTTPIAYQSAGSTALYGLLETDTVFTPAANQKFYIELTFDNY